MVARKFLVPDIGEFDEVEVIEVLLAAGDAVAVEQPVVTLESDKAAMELPSPFAGVIAEIHVSVGDKVAEGALIATIEVDTAAATDTPTEAEAAPSEVEPAAAASVGSEASPPGPREPSPAIPAAPKRAQIAAEEGPIAVLPPPPARAAHASPSVRRLAFELGVDLTRVVGSGRKGRIVKEDVQQFVKGALLAVPAQQPAEGLSLPAMPEIDFSQFGEIEVTPLNRIRKVSARNLHRSWITVPHVTQFDEADITELEAFRKERSTADGIKLTVLVFMMKALEVTLKDFPQFNSSLAPDRESLILKKYFHIGIAVDTENGLVVPVIRDVDSKGLLALTEELALVSEKARNRKLRPEDLSGGSITISSLGGIGGTAFTPIVNAPEVAVLGVSRAEMKPVWMGGEFVPRLMLPLSLSYDHRVIDGADAVRFTTRLKAVLSDIRLLAL